MLTLVSVLFPVMFIDLVNRMSAQENVYRVGRVYGCECHSDTTDLLMA